MKHFAYILFMFSNFVVHAREILIVAKPKIIFPTPFHITRKTRLPIRGTTDPYFYVFFYIDDEYVGETKSNHDGTFSYRLINKRILQHGVYQLTVKVVDPRDDMRVARTTVPFAVSHNTYYDSLSIDMMLLTTMLYNYGEE